MQVTCPEDCLTSVHAWCEQGAARVKVRESEEGNGTVLKKEIALNLSME